MVAGVHIKRPRRRWNAPGPGTEEQTLDAPLIPRGGTSAVHQLLREADGAIAPPGEHRLLFTLLGWNLPDAGLDHECPERAEVTGEARAFFRDCLVHECRCELDPRPSAEDLERFAWDWAIRFPLSWPELDVDVEWLVGIVHDVAARLARDGTAVEPQPVTAAILRDLIDRGLPIDPQLYALDPPYLEALADVSAVPRSPSGLIVEIPPFLVVGPTRRPAATVEHRLVLKASSDAYRVPTVRDVLAGWDVRWLHLVRNPLAAVNGLLDGWAHHGFWQHDLERLGWGRSAGEEPGEVPRCWWNFDAFPGWAERWDDPLVDVCVEQWRYPHERILANLGDRDAVTRARFEDFLAGGERREALAQHLAEGLGLQDGERLRAAAQASKPVNATAAPSRARWRRDRPHLAALAGREDVAAMARRLGYEPSRAERWT